jgi:hypothetical protein
LFSIILALIGGAIEITVPAHIKYTAAGMFKKASTIPAKRTAAAAFPTQFDETTIFLRRKNKDPIIIAISLIRRMKKK